MIENQKTLFFDLLIKLKSVDLNNLTAFKKNIPKFFDSIQKIFLEIQRSLPVKLDDLKVVSDIYYHTNNRNRTEGRTTSSFNQVINAAMLAITEYIFEMNQQMIPFYLKKGDWFFTQGRLEEALDAWEVVLKVSPDNEYIHSKLSQIMDTLENQAKA